MLPVLLILGAVFALLFLTRLGGAQRALIRPRWPAVVLAGAALALALRGAIWPAIACAALAGLASTWWPQIESKLRNRAAPATANDAEDGAARAVLGVSQTATADEIRAAYRAKMARAHPDRGGTHAEAARLAAARDRLLKKLK